MISLSKQALEDFPYLQIINEAPPALKNFRSFIQAQEGSKLSPYHDIYNNITIGTGRNLSENGISPSEELLLLDDDIIYHWKKIIDILPNFLQLSEARQGVLISISYNVGFNGFKEFKKLLEAVSNEDYETASTEILNSLAAKQLPNRYSMLAKIMENGIY